MVKVSGNFGAIYYFLSLLFDIVHFSVILEGNSPSLIVRFYQVPNFWKLVNPGFDFSLSY